MSTSRVDVGASSESFSGWTTTEVRFHGFANLPTAVGQFVQSPEFNCFGHQWVLFIFPGGRANSPEGYAAVALSNRSNTSIEIQYSFSVRDVNGKELVHCIPKTFEFTAPGSGHSGRCYTDFAKRSTIMDVLNYLKKDVLVGGSLVIEVRMKTISTDQFIPTNPLCKNVLQKFMDEETADVVFEVNNESCQNEEHVNKKSKTTTAVHAHRFILQDVSTMLAELCKSDGGIATVSITDVKPVIFKNMIYYTYGGKLPDSFLKTNAKDIIDACDRYGVVYLKLEAEAFYVKSTPLSLGNIMENLLYADAKNLTLLKEAVMDYIVNTNKTRIMEKLSFSNISCGMMTDLLAAMAREEDTEDDERVNYVKMRVGSLRKMLDVRGLEVDGSREAMIALLKARRETDPLDHIRNT